MKIRRILSTILFSIFVTSSIIGAIPEWYIVEFTQNNWFYGNQTDIQWQDSVFRDIGQVQIRRADNWWEYAALGFEWNRNTTLVISSPLSDFRLVNIDDTTKTFPATIQVEISKKESALATISPTVVPIPIPFNKTSILPHFSLSIDVQPYPEYYGTYTSAINFKIYVDYGLSTQVEIGSAIFNVLVYYVQQSPGSGDPEDPIFTNLMVQKYPEADTIDIPQLENTQGMTTVAFAVFSSNDDDESNSYTIRISPGETFTTEDVFAFYKNTNNSVYVPYKLVVPTRTSSQTGTFTITPPAIVSQGYWSDYFDLAITEMNYPNPPLPYTTGDYTSLIKIELIRND